MRDWSIVFTDGSLTPSSWHITPCTSEVGERV